MTANDTFDDILDRWEEAFGQGRDIPPEELCRDHPELLGPVKDAITRLERADRLFGGPAGGGGPAADPPSRFRPGDVIGDRYRLAERLAAGAFGEVWRAEEVRGGRAVAVKLPRSAARPPEWPPPLFTEIHNVLGMDHPNIVRALFAGWHRGYEYLVFRLVDGESLAGRTLEWRRTGPGAVTRAAEIAATLAAALAYIHRKGCIHRDLKPANILLDRRGWPYLTDFGIALTFREAAAGAARGTGTADYMAPEQLDPGRPLDLRCDLFALGVVLYEMVTGQLPFPTLAAKLGPDDPPRPSVLNPDVPPGLEAIILRCLSRDPAGRDSSADALLVALTWIGYGPLSEPPGEPVPLAVTEQAPPAPSREPATPPAPRRGSRGRLVWPVRVAVLAAVAAVGVNIDFGALAAEVAAVRIGLLPAAIAVVVVVALTGLAVVRPRRTALVRLALGMTALALAAWLATGLVTILEPASAAINSALRPPGR